ncbi:hypothetical protein FOE74_15600 [Rufibacter glacialis]|uniref:Uncharacterized protein n=1 Tax=Rufibacter glacialis TaxID=1259555 RepID=A0A5M8QBJ6_9BACT|nr:hypothetical protein FOE74_15600 [Rufibacter glacialis]
MMKNLGSLLPGLKASSPLPNNKFRWHFSGELYHLTKEEAREQVPEPIGLRTLQDGSPEKGFFL